MSFVHAPSWFVPHATASSKNAQSLVAEKLCPTYVYPYPLEVPVFMDTPKRSSAFVLEVDLNRDRSTLLSPVGADVAINFVGSVVAVSVTVSPDSLSPDPFFWVQSPVSKLLSLKSSKNSKVFVPLLAFVAEAFP